MLQLTAAVRTTDLAQENRRVSPRLIQRPNTRLMTDANEPVARIQTGYREAKRLHATRACHRDYHRCGAPCGRHIGKCAAGRANRVGIWEKRNELGQPEGWFRIVERDWLYEGQIIKICSKPGEDVAAWRRTRCEGEQKNAPVLGITFIKGMRRAGLKYENGTILDPRDGATYSAPMEVSADGQSLVVRGYLGIALLGRSEVWYRLPDDALEISKPGPGKKAHRCGADDRGGPQCTSGI
jgi:uncharacterized protein (DUF2147 family)